MIRVEFQRGAEIGNGLGPVALPARELAAGIEDVGKCGIKPQHGVVAALAAGNHRRDNLLAIALDLLRGRRRLGSPREPRISVPNRGVRSRRSRYPAVIPALELAR